MFVRSHKNLHTCKLPLAGLRSPIIKYARGSHIGFVFPLYKPDTFVRASNAQVRCIHYLHNLDIFKDDQQDYLTFAVTVNKHRNDFKFVDLTAENFKCLIFMQGLVSAEDAEIRRRVLTKLENEQGLTLKKLAEDCQRVVSIKSDSKIIEESGVAHIKKIKSKPTRYFPQKEKSKIEQPRIYVKQSTNRQKKSTTRAMLYLW